MAIWSGGVPYTRFRAVRVKDGKVQFVSGSYAGTQATETLTADRTWTFPDNTGQVLTTSSTDISGGSLVITTNDSTYTTSHDFLFGTTEFYVPRVLKHAFTSTGVTITGATVGDLVFVALDGTISGSMAFGGGAVNASNVATVICQNISEESWGLAVGSTLSIQYLVIS